MKSTSTGVFRFCKMAAVNPRHTLPMTWDVVVEMRGTGFGDNSLPGPRVYEGTKIRVWTRKPDHSVWVESFMDYPQIMSINLMYAAINAKQREDGTWTFQKSASDE